MLPQHLIRIGGSALFQACVLSVSLFSSQSSEARAKAVISLFEEDFVCPTDQAKAARAISEEAIFRETVDFDRRLVSSKSIDLYKVIQSLVEKDPSNFIARTELMLFRTGEYTLPQGSGIKRPPDKELLKELSAIHKLNPDYYKIYYAAVSTANSATVERKNIESILSCAKRLNPRFLDADFQLALEYAQLGEVNLAFTKLKELSGLESTNHVLKAFAAERLTRVAAKSEKLSYTNYHELLSAACRWTSEAFAKNPSDRRILLYRTSCTNRLLEFEPERIEELKTLNEALRKVDKVSPHPSNFDISISIQRHDWPGCIRYAKEGLTKLNPSRERFFYAIADCSYKMGRVDDAFDYAKKTITVGLDRGTLDIFSADALGEISEDPSISERAAKFVESLDETKYPFKPVWKCRMQAEQRISNLRPFGAALLPTLGRCRQDLKRLGLAQTFFEGRIIYGFSRNLFLDLLPKEGGLLLEELASRDPATVPPAFGADYVSRKVQDGNRKVALSYIDKLGRSTADGKVALGVYHLEVGDFDQARKIVGGVNTAELSTPMKIGFYELKRDVALKAGDMELAFTTADQAFKEFKGTVGLYHAVDILNEWKSPKDALTYLEKNFDPKNGETDFRLWTLWAHLLDKSGRPPRESRDKLLKAVSLKPNDALTLINLASTYAKEFNDCKSARPFIKRAADVVTNDDQESQLMRLMAKCGPEMLTIRNHARHNNRSSGE